MALPMARSYDGRAWEKTQGGAHLDLSCTAGAPPSCQATLTGRANFRIDTFDAGPELSADKLAAKAKQAKTKMEKQDRRLTESMRGSSGCAQHTAKYMS